MRATGKCLDDDCVKLNARHHISLPRPRARLHFNINMRQRKCVIFVSCASLSMAKQIKSKFKHIRCWGSRGSRFTYSECNIVLNIKFWKWKKWFHLFKCVQCRRGAYASAFNADKFKCFVYRESTMKIENWHRIDRVNSQWHFWSHTTHNICLNKLIRADFLFPRCGARSVCLTGNPRFIITVGTLFPRTKHTSSIAENYVANGSSFTTHTHKLIRLLMIDWKFSPCARRSTCCIIMKWPRRVQPRNDRVS